MRQVTLSQLESEMNTLAKQVGPERFAAAKRLTMEKVMVVDEDGAPVDPEEIEMRMYRRKAEDAAAPEDEKEEMPFDKMTEGSEEDEEEDKPKKSLAHARRKGLTAVPTSDFPAVHRKRFGSMKNFKDDDNGYAVEKAEAFGHWLLAQKGVRKSINFCEKKGLRTKAHTEGVNSAGGFLVPEVFETELINLREQFGVARQNCRIRPMTTDTHRIPRRSATLSPYFVGEATAITESTQTFEQVTLIAKKLAVLTTISSELNEDSFINIADDVAGEIAYAFAKREDECLFLGDGTSTYGGIVGLKNSMGSAGVKASTEYTTGYSAFTTDQAIGDLLDLMALLPQYGDTNNCKWYMHKSVFHAYAESASRRVGGNDFQQMLNGKYVPTLFGYPVVYSQILPDSSTTTNGETLLYFGDLTLATSFGDRRSTTIQVSDSAFDVFEQDEIAIRGTERFDINCHDTGDSSVAGPVVALTLTNAS